MEFQFYVVDVFTDKKFEGNQLAVFPFSEGISDADMQKIAKEFNYSETTFVTSTGEKNTRNVRIFTPESEVDFAGHPNIGTAMLLATIGEFSDEKQIDVIFNEKVGPIPLKINFENSKPQNAELSVAKLPEGKDETISLEQIAKIISLNVSDLVPTEKPLSFSCGLPFLFVHITTLEKLKQANLNRDSWDNYLSQSWAPQLYLFTKETELPNSNFHARMFAPALGISEDPATGSAAAALAGYVSEHLEKNDGTFVYVIEQGFEINRPSIMEMTFTQNNQKIESVKIKGNAVVFSQGKISL
jgi:trans-2,3-dihydro-3-hydroxyanthranilate isomerase